jgi:flagellar basal-body rod protein FlgF
MAGDVARLTTISQNLANAATAGFKKEIVVTRPFIDYLGRNANAAPSANFPAGAPRTESVTDHRAGMIKFTGNPLDIAIEDGGFFEVMTEQGPAYTRQGTFLLDVRGRLTTDAGLPVMGVSGELILTTSQPRIDAAGKIFDGENQLGQIKLVKFEDPRSLEPVGGGLYLAGPGSTTRSDGYDRMRQGHTEASNVNSMTEMVKMIETMRHFESSQRVIQAYDGMLDKTIRTLGEF